jgi:hypothetical protein
MICQILAVTGLKYRRHPSLPKENAKEDKFVDGQPNSGDNLQKQSQKNDGPAICASTGA